MEESLSDKCAMLAPPPQTLIVLLMEIVAPIVGGIAVALALMSWTPMPTWMCLLIALPTGTVLGWATMIGVFVVFDSLSDSARVREL